MPSVVYMLLLISNQGVLVVHKLLKLLLIRIVVIVPLELDILVLHVLVLNNSLLDLLPIVLFGISFLDLPLLLFFGLLDDGLFDKFKMVVYNISNGHYSFVQ